MPYLIVLRGPSLTTHKLPDGEVIWPGVLFNPSTGGTLTPPVGQGNVTSGGHATFTPQVLVAVQGAKDQLPEELHPAAEKFIAAAMQHLSNEPGDEAVAGFLNSPEIHILKPAQCKAALQSVWRLIDAKRLPKADVPGVKQQLLDCVGHGITEAEFKSVIAAIDAL
jgi:hypothetical protein